MIGQLPLPFELRIDYELDSFVRGGNGELCERLLALGAGGIERTGSGEMLWLHGPAGSGKTHLLQGVVGALAERGVQIAYLPARQLPVEHVLAVLEGSERYAVLVIDDVDQWLGEHRAESELVRRYQERRHAGTDMILSASSAPSEFDMALADWRSRAQGAQVFRLNELTEEGKLQVLMARSDRLGLTLGEAVGTYLLRHGPRGLPQMLAVLDRADKLALAEQRKLTIPLIKKALASPAGGAFGPASNPAR